MLFRTPNFYKDFKCKGKACRKCCCEGWGISLTQAEYYHLLGVKASAKLRQKLDRSFQVLNDATPKRYAILVPNYLGDCPMHMENGYCQIECELGEKVIPTICRYYPRMPRLGINEVGLSNSCEKVLEILNETPDISYQEQELAFSFQPLILNSFNQEENIHRQQAIQCILKKEPLFAKIKEICTKLNTSNCSLEFLDNKELFLRVGRAILLYYADDFVLTTYISKAINELKLADNINFLLEHYQEYLAKETINNDFFSKVIANYFFNIKFPYSFKHINLLDEGISFYITYAFLELTFIGNSIKTDAELIDYLGVMFRLIEHSSFQQNILAILNKSEHDVYEQLPLGR